MSGIMRIKTGSRFEDQNSFSRAVRAGNFIFSSNSSGRNYATNDLPETTVEQMLGAISNIERAFRQGGATIRDVVRVQISFADPEDQKKILDAFASIFKSIDPALTLICQPFHGSVKVEVEMIAYTEA